MRACKDTIQRLPQRANLRRQCMYETALCMYTLAQSCAALLIPTPLAATQHSAALQVSAVFTQPHTTRPKRQSMFSAESILPAVIQPPALLQLPVHRNLH
jgi:hypothetical protein